MKFDLHVHSSRSVDSNSSYEQIYKVALKRGLSGVAICDHNVFAKPPACERLIVIPGCEYSTDAGHILTLFLTSPIEDKLKKNDAGLFNWRQVVDAAHEQGALTFLAHPYAPNVNRSNDVWQAVDGIEIFNSRIEHSSIKDANSRAQSTCLSMNKVFSAGSDAHFPLEVGSSFWECDTEPTLDAVKAALLSGCGRVYAGTASPLYRPMSQWLKMIHQKNFKIAPKIVARFAVAFLRLFRKTYTGYINMKGR